MTFLFRIPFLQFALAFTLLWSSASAVFAQSITCPDCPAGICAGESLADYVVFSGYTFPIEIISATGAATGTGTNIFNYSFAGGPNSVTLTFTEGNGTVHTETFAVNVNAVNAQFSYAAGAACGVVNFNGGASSASGSIVSYQWSVFQINGAITSLLTTLTGQNPTYTFSTGGVYEVCLTVTDNNGCTSEICNPVNVGDVTPGLNFTGGGSNLSEDESQLVVPYCNSTTQGFILIAADDSELNGSGVTNYTILVEGVSQYTGSNPPGATSIYTAEAGTVGYIQVDLIITDLSGCSYTTSYQVYIGNFSTPSFSSQLATTALGCPEQELVIQNNNNPENPNGSDYTLRILCGSDSTEIGEWIWEQSIPEDNLLWTPPFSSCLCDDGQFYFSTSAEHPCMTTPQLATSNFQVALPPEAEFDRNPEGNICDSEEVTFEWLFGSNLDYPASWNWCSPAPEWHVTDPAGITETVGYDPILDYVFPGPGIYEVCLKTFSDCGTPEECETICVNPSLDDVTLFPEWNIPEPMCPDDAFIATATFTDLDYCEDPELSWVLYNAGGAAIQTFEGDAAEIADLPKGEYILELIFTLEDCGEVTEEIDFEVVDKPMISTTVDGPFDEACAEDEICFDDWFCIDDCGDPLSGFSLALYTGYLDNCEEVPAAAPLVTFASSVPQPPYDPCDPNPAVCNYVWTAVPGQYTLFIMAENHCGPDFACIEIDIPEPEVPEIEGEVEACLNETAVLTANLAGGTFTFESCPGDCPQPGTGAGQYTTDGNELNWTTADGINPPGTYTLSYGGDCIGTGEFEITLNPLPLFDITAGPGVVVCPGDEVSLGIDYFGPSDLDGCTWVNTSTGQPVDAPSCAVTVNPVTGTTVYAVTVTDINGCTAEDEIELEEVAQGFTADCSALQTSYCNNAGSVIDLTALLSPYPAAGSITWALNGTPVAGTEISLDGLADGSYSLAWSYTHPDPPNCVFEGACSFDIAPAAQPVLTGGAEFCIGETVTAGATVPGGIPGTWTFTDCPGPCPDDFTSTASGLTWPTAASSQPGTYTLTYGGDCIAPQSLTFELFPLPEISVTGGGGGTVCGGDEVVLGIDYAGPHGPLDCDWVHVNSGASLPSSDCEITVSPDAPATYSVTAVDQNGCSASATIDIELDAQPFTLDCSSIAPSYCANEQESLQLADLVSTDPGSSEFSWTLNGAPITGTSIEINTLAPGDYTLAYTYTGSAPPACEYSGDCTFSVTGLTAPIITANTPLCMGQTLQATVSQNAGIAGAWSFSDCPGACPDNFNATANALTWATSEDTPPGSYTLNYGGNCLQTASLTFEVNPLPEIQITALPGNVICADDEVILGVQYSGPGSLDCTWSDADTGAELPSDDCTLITPLAGEAQNFQVAVTDLNGCGASDAVSILTDVQPFDFDCSSIAPSYCANEDEAILLSDLVSIDPGAPGFTWTLNGTPLTDAEIDINTLPPSSDPYILSYTFTAPAPPECTYEGECSFFVTGLTAPVITSNAPLCLGETLEVALSENNGIEGNWSFTNCPGPCPDDFTETPTTLIWTTDTATPAGTYTLTYGGDCLETATYTFEVHPLPDFEITALPGNVICIDEAVTLDIDYSGPGTPDCVWSDSDSGEILPSDGCTLTAPLSGSTQNFSVTVTDLNGCSSNEDISVEEQQQPFTFDCGTLLPAYCANDLTVIQLDDLVGIDATGPGFLWYLNGDLYALGSIAVADLGPGSYTIAYSYSHGDAPFCLFEGECSFEVSGLTVPEIEGESGICLGTEIAIEVSGTGGFEGEWTFADCPGPCPDDAVSDPTNFSWQSTDADLPGTYTVAYAGVCLETVTFSFELFPLPDFDITAQPDALICTGDSVVLGLNYNGSAEVASCTWTDDATGDVLPNADCEVTVTPAGVTEAYTLTVVDTNACEASQSIALEIQQQPFTFSCAPIDSSYCDNEVVTVAFDELTPGANQNDITWLLNGVPLAGSGVDIGALNPADEAYVLTYVYTHPEGPNCTFSDSCSFFVTELTMPTVAGNSAVCLNDTIALASGNTAGFEGAWTFTSCPGNDCPENFSADSEALIWPTEFGENPHGIYTVQYTGTCLDTAYFDIELYDLPPFSILTAPGATACAEDTIYVTLEYTGTSITESCILLNAFGDTLASDGGCTWTLLPEGLQSPYTMAVTDTNACANVQTVDIDIQEQPFTFDCTPIDSSYCDNSPEVISLADLITPAPANGTLNWFLNDAPYTASSIAIESIAPGDYSLSYTYVHGDAPNCTFTGGCYFEVTPLTVPEIVGEAGFCSGETVELEALNNGGYNGVWSNTACPQPPCITETGTPDTFVWNSAGAALGTYTMTYGGECLQTVTHTFTLLDGPVVSWIPEDDTPCLNECFPFAPEVVDNYSSFGWLYETDIAGGALSGNEVCFETIGNPEVLDICLWAELDHVVEGQPYTCRAEACHTIEPVFSPGNYPDLPAFACPGETIDLNVDAALYDGCLFSLHGVADYTDCSAVTIPDELYGNFTYEVFLYYQGCTDTLSGNLFVPQPPSAALELDYDPCIADVQADLLNLSGDLLEFEWSIYDNPGNDFGYLLDVADGQVPVPNPIPLSQLFLPTDTTFYIEILIANVCDTLILTDTVNFIAPPSIGIDISGEPGGVFCLPHDLQFEIGQFATQYIDSVVWSFTSLYDYGNITDTVFYNLEYPPPFSFQNNGVSDTVYVEATAYNICGSGSDSLSFILVPPSVYLEMPDWAEGLCPGGEVTIPTLQVEGNPTSCTVSSNPLIPGLANVCHAGFDSVTVAVPPSTPAGVYTIVTTVEGCGSWSDFTYLEVFAVPDVDFAMPENACTEEEIDFINLTEGAEHFTWSFGSDSAQWTESQLSFPSHSFGYPGVYGVQLIAVSAEGCTDSTFQWIDIFGPDPEVILADDALCSGGSTTASFPDQADLISIYWEFLLPGRDTLIYTAQQTVEAGFTNSSSDVIDKWEVTLELEDRFGCRASGQGLVFVYPIPRAYFTHGDLEGCAQAAEIQFTNGSTPNTSSLWNFNDPQTGTNNVSYQRNPTHIFSRAGRYDVMLTVENSFGCSADFSRLLACDHLAIYVPNAFSPDGNNINEIFKPVIHGVEYFDNGDGDYYLFEIHNRWGERIFHTNEPSKGWDGSSPNGKHYAQPEVYQWQLMLVTPYGTERRNGHVVLLR